MSTSLLLAMLGCESDPPAALPGAPGPLVHVSLSLRDGEARFGELAVATLVVANGGVQPILVRAIELPGQLPDPVCWLGSRPGRLLYDSRWDRYVWRFRERGETAAAFAAGWLLPGEILTTERVVRVRGPRQEVSVVYQEVPQTSRAGTVYLRWDARVPVGKRESESWFVASSVSAESGFRRFAPGSEQRLALVFEPTAWPVERRTYVASVAWSDPDTLPATLIALGHPGAELSRWNASDAWLVRDLSDGALLCYLPGQQEPERYQGVGFTVFDLADQMAQLGAPVGILGAGADAELETIEPSSLLEVLDLARSQGRGLEVRMAFPDTPDRVPILQFGGAVEGDAGQ